MSLQFRTREGREMQTDSNPTPPAVHSCAAYSDPFFAFPLRAMLARCVVAVGLEQVATCSGQY